MAHVTRTTVLLFLLVLGVAVLPAQVGRDLASFAGGWRCSMDKDRLGSEGNGESCTRQCRSPDAGLTIRRTSSHGAVLVPLHPRMYETSLKGLAGITFGVDDGEMMRYGPRTTVRLSS